MDFRSVIEEWPSRAELASDCGVSYGVVKQWHLRNSIPGSYWSAISRAALLRDIEGVTTDSLATLANKAA